MLAIVDSGGANIASVRFALERLGVRGVLTANPAVIRAAERVILPGVGSAQEGMKRLQAKGLVDCVCGLKQPVLGICLGMQLLFESSAEGDTTTRFYFVHSFAGPVNEFTLASCAHGTAFAAVVRRGNFHGVQFHPERSGPAGAQLLRNFLEMPV